MEHEIRGKRQTPSNPCIQEHVTPKDFVDHGLIESDTEFRPGLKGQCRLRAGVLEDGDRRPNTHVKAKIGDSLMAVSEKAGYKGFGVKMFLDEVLLNAMQHGCGFNPEETVGLSWNVEDGEAAFTVSNKGSRLFYPPKYLGREMQDVVDQVTDDGIISNIHAGMQLIVKYTEGVNYLWRMPGSSSVHALLREKPDSTLEDFKWEFNSYREKNGRRESIDLKGIEERGEVVPSEEVLVRGVFKPVSSERS